MLQKPNNDQPDVFTEGIEEITDDISDVKAFDIPVLVIFLILFVIVALQFFTRYVLNDSLGWTEEIARYFIILLGFVGGITCVRKNKHIYLEFAYKYLPMKLIKPIILGVRTTETIFWFYAGILAIELASKTKTNMVSIVFPKAYLYYVLALSCFMMAFFAAKILIREYGKTPEAIAHNIIRHTEEGE